MYAILSFMVHHEKTIWVNVQNQFIANIESYGFNYNYVVSIVTNTTRNISIFGVELRKKYNTIHLYYIDYNLHRYVILAYDDNNILGADGVMKNIHSIYKYFNKSTQALEKLLNTEE